MSKVAIRLEVGLKHAMNQVRESIIRWFEVHGRQLPWRTTTDPYRVLIAEMMLRRTTAKAVSRVYPLFIERFPTVQALADAHESEVVSVVATLGLQSVRTAHMIATARELKSTYGGSVPSDLTVLTRLPGVGRYVASAVLNFAFGRPVPLVDGNILHLIRRVFGIDLKGSEGEASWQFMTELGGAQQDRRLYWGIIDLVATVCLRKAPRCGQCPLNQLCQHSTSHSSQATNRAVD